MSEKPADIEKQQRRMAARLARLEPADPDDREEGYEDDLFRLDMIKEADTLEAMTAGLADTHPLLRTAINNRVSNIRNILKRRFG